MLIVVIIEVLDMVHSLFEVVIARGLVSPIFIGDFLSPIPIFLLFIVSEYKSEKSIGIGIVESKNRQR